MNPQVAYFQGLLMGMFCGVMVILVMWWSVDFYRKKSDEEWNRLQDEMENER